MMNHTCILPLTHPEAALVERAGGKGAALARLTRGGFSVPAGFVVTVDAYRAFWNQLPDRRERVRQLFTPDEAARLRRGQALRAALAELALPDDLARDLGEALAGFPAEQPFAVRSSSVMEDLAGAAFAGQHDTFLNCVGAEAVGDRVRDCFLSLWSDRAVAYRQQGGFDHAAATMAVVVQAMVPSETAGVGFSVNPVNGRLDEMVVDANFGLGESVVGGEAPVDHWILDKATGEVRQARIARKTEQVSARNGTTMAEPVDAARAERPSLSEDQLRRLAGLLRQVEEFNRFPQDLEWAFVGEELFLLQARPVTVLPPRWTRDESAERFPNAVTPLTWDFVEAGFHRSLACSLRLMGLPPFPGKWFGMHGHYIYGNQNAVELYLGRLPVKLDSLEQLEALIPRLRTEYRWVQELPVKWSRDLDHYLIRLGEFRAEPLAGRTLAELWRHVLAINEHGARYFEPNIAISITHGTLYRLLHRLLVLAVGAADAARFCDGLLAFCETKTGQINRELHELAALARTEPALADALPAEGTVAPAREDRLASHPRVARFLRDHGHREVDFDAYAPTWGEQPVVVLDLVRMLCEAPPARSPVEQEREAKLHMLRTERQLFQRLPDSLHFFFHELLRLVRAYTALDDLEHYQTTRLTPVLRRGLRALGDAIRERGGLIEPMDIFFAHVDQITEAIETDTPEGWRRFAGQVREQKRAYEADRARSPAWTLDETASESAVNAEILTGLAGSPGTAEGPVCVVIGPEDFATFPRGAVLVARTTSPTWTPLFYSAAAVITESGGPLSHGAVTAREIGIPAVMSVHGCLTRLAPGERVRVEGAQGRVLRLAD